MKAYKNFNEMFDNNSGRILKNRPVQNTVRYDDGAYDVFRNINEGESYPSYDEMFSVATYKDGVIYCPKYLNGNKVNASLLRTVADELNNIVRKYGLEFEVKSPSTTQRHTIEYVKSPNLVFGKEKGADFIDKIAKKLASTIEAVLEQGTESQKSAWNPEWDADFE